MTSTVVAGYLDSFSPMLDKGSAGFDIRHRISLAGVWDLPVFKNGTGIAHQVLGGWEIAPIFQIRTGSPYSIFDSTNGGVDAPRAGFFGPVPTGPNSHPAANENPNSFDFLTVPANLVDPPVNPIYGYTDVGPFPADMSGRNAFRSPGFWNLDLGLYKNFSLTERVHLQLRGEAYNITNHANMYTVGSSADLANYDIAGGDALRILSCKGCSGSTTDRRNLQLGLKVVF